jgi:hypothetical protein
MENLGRIQISRQRTGALIRSRLPIAAAVMFLLLFGNFEFGRCNAQDSGGSVGGKHFSPDLKDAASGSPQKPHSVTLSWNPSLPSTKSLHDVIIGYIVYRSAKPHDRKAHPINYTQVTGTTFVDSHVSPGKVYYYVTRAVSARGALSAPSNEVQVKIPH